MQTSKFTVLGAIAVLAIGGGGFQTCVAQSAQSTPQNYGAYGSPQASPQSATTGQPGATACQNILFSCHVTVCTNPCQGEEACDRIKRQIPGIHTPPTCQEVMVCEIADEGPPTAQPITLPIYRNCYVPIRIKKVEGPGPGTIVPVNIQVNWREVHVLCDSKGVPLPAQKAAEILKELSESLAKGNAPAEATSATAPAAAPVPAPAVSSAAPAQPAATVPAAAPASATPAPLVAQATDVKKQWVWLSQEGVYGFGYQRTDGMWEIDPDSRRATLQ